MNSSTIRTGNLTLDVKVMASCDYHRLVLPYSFLEDADCSTPTFVFNRVPTAGIGVLLQMRKAGVRVIADIDDLPELDHRHYLYNAFQHNGTSRDIVESLRLAHVVTCTTQYLADQLSVRYEIPMERIVVIPNALPFDRSQFRRVDRNSDTTFVYAAGASHYRDATMLPPGRPDVTFAGYEPSHPEWIKIKQVHEGSKFVAQRALHDYMQVYQGHSVALAPLRPGVFNQCKSNLKMLEAGAAGLAFMASEVLPYFNFTDQRVVTFARSDNMWRDEMWRFSMSEAMREDAGDALAAHVREHYDLFRVNQLRKHILQAPF